MSGIHFCPKCGARLEEGDVFCANCGAKLVKSEPVSAGAVPPAPERGETRNRENKSGGKVTRFLVMALVALLTYGGGRLLGGQMAKGNKVAQPTAVPLAINPPIATLAPVPTPLSGEAMDALLAVPTLPPVQSQAHWNCLEADDSAISAAMTLFWYGSDSATGADCAFFMNNEGTRGGYYWWKRTSESFQASFDMGELEDYGSDTEGYVISWDGEKTRITLGVHDDGSIDFNFGSGEYIRGSMRLYLEDAHRQEVLNMILNYKHTLSKMS